MSRAAPILGRFRYGYVAPAALLVAVLLYAPFVWTAYLSLTRYDGLESPVWVGLANFAKLFDDAALLISTRNTLIWVIGTMVLPVGLGLLVAVLSYDIRGGAWYRVPFMLPYALSGAGLAMVWSPVLSHDGIANLLLGVDTAFLQEAPTNTFAMLAVWTWQQLGVNTLLFVVGLQSIPKEPIEAARLDGASGWRLFRHVIWPLMRPLTAVVVGLALVSSLKTFDIVWVLTQGGPGRNSETLAVTMYKETFVASDYGYGSAVAVMLTVVTGLASYLYLRRQVTVA
ncbi:carbohydrate ABC transporter permease [Nonomuraea gerenzanensis]|uniref:Binding-protein-dependent transport systems inner membrane component n=1 Tax=Nonomuraea gerenzanensis TaxID=93944 RepID=A0A1M4DWK2_9ACTN|nr:sugar ABC transporter permease [Nonomuraea gerenzanensis]UBU13291.1 sugar ABC transporter permease [Nonomuraea gerenzanensis]SBO90944.1 binding-protein-dependent transport systems inner membrane component [Nonomuraea gerenzanensis]